MAGYPSGMYGTVDRKWQRILLIAGIVFLAGVVLFAGYHLLNRGTTAESQAATSEVTYGKGASDANSQVAALITQAVSSLNNSPMKIIEVRDRLNEILPMQMGVSQRKYVKEQLSKLSDEWFFSSKVLAGDKLCSSYKVQSGDLLVRIGSQHKVPYEILMEINKISKPQQLRVDDIIKVINGPFHAKVYRSNFTLDLYLQNTFVKSFTVGLGKQGKDTPTGLWQVKSDGKLISPTWTDPDTGKTYKASDPDYPLGSRWIALQGIEGTAVGRAGFAIHGTKDPNQIGKAESRGCIRMYNDDAVLMYNMLMPGVSQVQVMD